MKPKGNTSVRELLGNNEYSETPFRDYTDETYQRIVNALGEGTDIKHQVSFKLSKEQKFSFYQDVKDRIENGVSSDEIARDVLASVDEHLEEKYKEAIGETNPKLKGGFRRVE